MKNLKKTFDKRPFIAYRKKKELTPNHWKQLHFEKQICA